MEGKVIHMVVALAQNLLLPVSESIHGKRRASAGHRLNVRVHKLHQAAGLRRNAPVLLCSLVAHLPGAVHLITKAPELNVMRLLIAVFSSQVAVISAFLKVAVFQYIFGVLRPSGSKIHSHHHLGARFLCPVRKLI